MKMRPVGAESFHAEEGAGGHGKVISLNYNQQDATFSLSIYIDNKINISRKRCIFLVVI